MRRQYHARRVNGRNLIWDVHRLVELTKNFPIKEVPLSRIRELDENFWFEGTLPTCRAVTHHAKLIAETDLKYPIILCAEGRVMDGMHRVCKALLEGRETVTAVQFERIQTPTTSTLILKHCHTMNHNVIEPIQCVTGGESVPPAPYCLSISAQS